MSIVVRTRALMSSGARSRRTWIGVAAAVALIAGSWAAPAMATAPVGGCTTTWQGAASGGLWSTAGNWTGGWVPGSATHTSDEVCIASTATVTLDNGPYTVAAINDNGSFATSPGSLLGSSGLTNPSLTITGTGVPASSLGAVVSTNATLTVQSGASLSATSLSMGATPGGKATLGGAGSVTVAGDIAFSGGDIQGPGTALALAQTGTHNFTVGTGNGANSYLYYATITTPNNVSFTGTTLFSFTDLTTTGNLIVGSGAALTQNSTLSAHGVVTSGTGGAVGPSLTLTGTSSSVAANLTVGGLTVNSGASLSIPTGVKVTSNAGSGHVTGLLTGAGEFDVTGSNTTTVDATGTLSVAAVKIDGGSLTTAAGSTVNVTGVTFNSGTWNSSGAASVGSGGLNATSTSTFPSLVGPGSITVAGDVTLAGAETSGNLSLAQTGSHNFSISNGIQGQSYIYNATITTPNAISDSGTTLYSGATVTAAGNLELAPGANLAQSSTLSFGGITTTVGTTATVQPGLTITGTTSSLGADVSVQDITVASGGRLFVPSPRVLTVPSPHLLTVNSGGSLTGNGRVAGAVVNNGTVAPGTNATGSTVGTLTVGTYTQSGTGAAAIQESASGNDKISVTGATPVAFSGKVAVTTLTGYSPASGASITVVSAPSASGVPVFGSPLSTTDDLAVNHYGTPIASGNDVVVVRPAVAPKATVTPSTTKLVITTGGAFIATCAYNLGPIKTCAVTAKSAKGVVLATGKPVTVVAGAAKLGEKLTLTPAGVAAAKAAGGVPVILTATVTPLAGSALVAKASLVVVNKSIKVTLLGNVLFGSNSAALSPAGKAALIRVARQIQGAKTLECDGHTASTGNPSGEHVLGLQRATVACTFIKAEIKLLKLKPILHYVVKSYGATRPVSKNQALNRRVEFIVSN